MAESRRQAIGVYHHWCSLSLPARSAVMGLVILILAISAHYGYQHAGTSEVALLSGRKFSDLELTRIEAAFGKARLNQYRFDQRSVLVPHELRADYIGALVDAKALPANIDLDLQEAIQQSSPFESQQQRAFRLQAAKQRELGNILRTLPDIEDASVQIDEEQTGRFRREQLATAMVVVKPVAGVQLDPHRIRSIRQLIAASEIGLEPQHVTITDLSTGITYCGKQHDDSEWQRADEYALRKTTHEREWTVKMGELLKFIDGVQIAASVELGTLTELGPAARAQFQPGDPVPERTTGSLIDKAVSVSVGVPQSYYLRVRQQQQQTGNASSPPLSPQAQLERIEAATHQQVRDLVNRLLPRHTASQVTVRTIQDVAGIEQLAVGATSSAWNLIPLVTVVLMVGLIAVLSLRGAWSEVVAITEQRSQPAPPAVVPETIPSVITAEVDREAEDRINPRLTQLVREDPQAAADMVKRGLRNAG